MQRFVLIDGHSLLFRAYHALPKVFSDREGRPTNAVYGFMSMLIRVVNDLEPDYLVVAFDEAAPTLRHSDLVTYKEGRPEMDGELKIQVPIVRQMLTAFSVPVLSIEGYEGEDVIATVVAKLKTQNSKLKTDLEFYIVSGDRDVLQLVNENVRVYSPKKGITEPVIYDEGNVKEVFGVAAEKIPDFKGLRGDSSDRIPGVFGIGQKTAVSLLNEFGSLENVYKRIGEVRGKFGESVEKKLAEGAEQAVLSKKLGTIFNNAPVALDLSQSKFHRLENSVEGPKFLEKLGFKSLIKRLTGQDMLGGEKKKKTAKTAVDGKQAPLL